MHQRSWQVLKGLLHVIVAGALTWLLSWFMQYVGELTIPGQHFHLNQESNRLAFVTVLATVVVMIAVVLLVILDGCITFWIIVLAGAGIVTGIGWVAVRIFPGTTIVTEPAQWIYGIAVILWGMLMWYVFLGDITAELAEAD